MKRILIIISAFAVVMCTKAEPAGPQTEYSEQAEKVRIKVMSSNIRSGQDDANNELARWPYRKFAYMNMLSDTQPDLIGLQECSAEKVETLSIASEYGMWLVPTCDVPVPNVTDDQLPPNVIMYRKSKFELLDKGVFYYNEADPAVPCHNPCGASGWQVRGSVWVKLQVKENGRILYFFDTHYTHDPEEIIDPETGKKHYNIEERRKASLIAVEQMEKIVKEKDAALFLVGDLNCSLADGATRNGPRSLEPLTEYMWSAREDAHSYDGAISFNGFTEYKNGKVGNIDHIFYRGAEALDFVTVNSPDYGVTYISDHYPVMCGFEI